MSVQKLNELAILFSKFCLVSTIGVRKNTKDILTVKLV